jgi:tetratricopeptide (TPR) repeat protein
VVLLLAACAQAPIQTPPPPAPQAAPAPSDTTLAATIARYRQSAQRAEQAGDLAAAERDWHVVALLAPDDSAVRAQHDAVRAAIRRGVRENLQAGNAALTAGDPDRASAAWLKVLGLDPDNAEALKALREIDRQKLQRVAGGRAARVNQATAGTANGSTGTNGSTGRQVAARTNESVESYDIDQRIEMFRAGDLDGGLREFRAFVDANPGNDAARARIATVVYQRAGELEGKGSREQALTLYEQAVSLRGKPVAEWNSRMQSVRKALSDDYYEKGMQAYRTDTAAAIKLWETSLRYDAQNRRTVAKLMEARMAQEKLKRIDDSTRK